MTEYIIRNTPPIKRDGSRSKSKKALEESFQTLVDPRNNRGLSGKSPRTFGEDNSPYKFGNDDNFGD